MQFPLSNQAIQPNNGAENQRRLQQVRIGLCIVFIMAVIFDTSRNFNPNVELRDIKQRVSALFIVQLIYLFWIYRIFRFLMHLYRSLIELFMRERLILIFLEMWLENLEVNTSKLIFASSSFFKIFRSMDEESTECIS